MPDVIFMQTLTETLQPKQSGFKRTFKLFWSLVGFAILLVGQALFGAIHWLNLPTDSLASLKLITFPELKYPSYFWTVLLIAGGGLLILLWSLCKVSVSTVRDFETAAPPALRFKAPAQWRIPFLVLIVATVIMAGAAIWLAISNRGDLHPLVWLAALVLVGLTLYAVDRNAGGQSVPTLGEATIVTGYLLWLLLLGFLFKNIGDQDLWLRVIIGLAGTAAAFGLWRTKLLSGGIIAFGLLGLLGLSVYTYGLTDWKYAYVGDEYAFFDKANHLLTHVDTNNLLAADGVYDLNPVFASYIHSFTMALYGPHVFGWRIGETLMVLLTAPLLYLFVRRFASVRVGALAVLIFLASHHLLALSKIGYNNLQALAPFVAALALAMLAAQRRSWLGIYLCSVASAFTFYTYGITIPFVVLIGGLLLLVFRGQRHPKPNQTAASTIEESENITLQTANEPSVISTIEVRSDPLKLAINWLLNLLADWPVVLLFSLGFLLTALPRFVNYDWLIPLTNKTVAQSEVKVVHSALTEQILPNFLYTLTATLHFNDDSHYMSGAHLDPLSSLLMLVGLGWLLTKLWRRVASWLVGSFVAASFFVGGLASYPYPVNTRTFILLPFYAIFAAIGGELLLTSLSGFKLLRRAAWVVVPITLLAIMVLNLYQFENLSVRNDPQNDIGIVVKEFQEQSANTTFYQITSNPHYDNTRLVLDAYGYNSDRLIIIPGQTDPNTISTIKRTAKVPYRILISSDLSNRGQWLQAVRDNWPTIALSESIDAANTSHFTVLAYNNLSSADNTAVQPISVTSADIAPGTFPTQAGTWQVEQPRDIAVGADKLLYVINGVKRAVEVYSADGKLVRTINGGWKEPFSLAFNSKNELIVLDSGQVPYLTRLNTDGKILARYTGTVPNSDIYFPRTVAIDSNDDIYVADTGRARVLHFSPDFVYISTITGGDKFKQPASLGFVGDKLLVLDEATLYILNKTGEIITSWTIPKFYTAQPARILRGQSQNVVITSPASGEILFYDLQGKQLKTVGPPTFPKLRFPVGIASADGKVFVIENEGNLLRAYDWNG